MTATSHTSRSPSYGFDDFKARAEAGHSSEVRVARLLRYWGYEVEDPVLRFADRNDRAAIADFTRNQKDLELMGLSIEVKSRTFAFRTRDDYPYDTALLETVSGYKAKAKKPDVYVLVSQVTGGILVVDARQMDQFPVVNKVDRSRNLPDQWYICPRAALRPHTWLEGFLAAHKPLA